MQAKTLLSSSAALVVVLFLFVVVMPHCRSSASRLARRARALDRGFIVPCDGARHVLVPHALQLRVKAITHSLNLHDKHDTLAGTRSHFARLASVAAYRGEHISLGELNIASKSHQRANSAKHGGHDSRDRAAHCRKWADVDDGGSSQAGSVPAAPCRDTPSVDADLGCPATPLLGVPGGASGCADVASPAAMPWCFFAKFEMLIDRLLDKMDVTIPLLSDSKVPEVKVPSTSSEALVPTLVSMTVEFNNLKAEVAELQVQLKRTSDLRELLVLNKATEPKEPEKQDCKDKIEDLVLTLDSMKAEVAKVQVQLKRTGEGHKNLLVQVGDLVRESSNSILEKVVELNEASHIQIFEALCSREAAFGASLDSLSPSPLAGLVNVEVETSGVLCPSSPLPAPTSSPDLNESSDGQDLWDTGFISMGASVQLAGLVSAPHLNGCLGCVSGFDALKDRFAVAIKGAGTNLFRLANLKIECSVCEEFAEPGELCMCAFGAPDSNSRDLWIAPTSFVQETSSGCCSAAGSEPAEVVKVAKSTGMA